jgi:hypothetical protein
MRCAGCSPSCDGGLAAFGLGRTVRYAKATASFMAEIAERDVEPS